MRRTLAFNPSGTPNWRALQRFSTFLARRGDKPGEWLMGVGVLHALEVERPGRGFDQLRTLLDRHDDWAFGHLGYQLGAEVEPGLASEADPMGWPALHFFVPRFVVHWEGAGIKVFVMDGDEKEAERLVKELSGSAPEAPMTKALLWKQPERAHYLEQVAGLLSHIQRGDIYEVNYCVTRTADAMGFDPYPAFAKSCARLNAPHAAFYRMDQRFALCQSPERFIRIRGNTIVGEPMKGTRPRHADRRTDEALAMELANNAKERSENIMAVDVLRHDLSRVAAPGSVRVDELCAVKSLPAVHQMTSTVSAELRSGLHPVDAIQSCFPMASMTGAPKKSAMELIAATEDRPRGLYSGTLGYFTPEGDVDLNVVIRTILFDERTGQASLTTGSAVTAACDPEKEWEECELKARSVLDALDHAG